MERITFIPKIDVNTNNLKNICKNNILFKYTCKGIKFLEISKSDAINNKLKINNIFNNFTKPMYETLLHDCNTKIYLDLDFKNMPKEIYNNKNRIFIDFDKHFVKFLNDKNINYQNIIYMDASRKNNNNNNYKLSLHIVVNGVAFKNRNILKKLIIEFKNTFSTDNIYYQSIDTGIYGTPQLFKCVLSPSKDDSTLLLPFTAKGDDIKFVEKIDITDNINLYLVGVYNDNDNIEYIDEKFKYLLENNNENNKIVKNNINNNIFNDKYFEKKTIPDNTKKWIENNYNIKNIYKIRSDIMINNKINLTRIIPSHCSICNRTHESENGYCQIDKNNIIFYCGRNSNGKVIGSWYKKKDNCKFYTKGMCNKGDKCNFTHENNEPPKTTDNITKEKLLKDNIELTEAISKLRIYIEKIECKYNEALDNIKKISENICNNVKSKGIDKKKYIKKYTEEMYDSLWNKYYFLGKSIEENIENLYDNLITTWKDGNISRLKNRAIRIYRYMNTFKENIKGYSLRNLFHMKNYEFYECLHTTSIN